MDGIISSRSAQWIEKLLRESAQSVVGIEVLHESILQVTRKDLPSFNLGVISTNRVEAVSLEGIFGTDHIVDFVVNIPKEAYWTGEAIKELFDQGAAFGGVADLYRALREEAPDFYVNPEFKFFERIIRQHPIVVDIVRGADRRYIIKRSGLIDISVVIINEYEVTADHIRVARDRYGEFENLLITNPNGNPSHSANETAKTLGVTIFNLRQFLGRLKRQ